jgi:hypothetical protein
MRLSNGAPSHPNYSRHLAATPERLQFGERFELSQKELFNTLSTIICGINQAHIIHSLKLS